MNLIAGYSLSCFVVQFLLNVLLMKCDCSYLDLFYKTLTPKQWTSSTRNHRTHSFDRYLRPRPIHYANPQPSNKFMLAPTDVYQSGFDAQSKANFDNPDRQSIYDQPQSSLEQSAYERLPIKNQQLDRNPFDRQLDRQPQTNPQSNENQRSEPPNEQPPSANCNCAPIVKTKYIAIEIPKIVRVPSESSSQSSSNYEQTTPSALNASFNDLESRSNAKSNDGLVSKTRIITIRELPSTMSKTILVNSIEERTRLNAKNANNLNMVRPSRVQPIPASLTTYVGFEDAAF